jgi:hypothetical protein
VVEPLVGVWGSELAEGDATRGFYVALRDCGAEMRDAGGAGAAVNAAIAGRGRFLVRSAAGVCALTLRLVLSLVRCLRCRTRR